MAKFLYSYSNTYNFGLLILRLGLSIMYFLHGYPKLAAGPEKWEKTGAAVNHLGIEFAPAFWGFIAALTETGGAALLLLGFLFRPACFFLLITMFVAAFMKIYTDAGFPGISHPVEMGLVFLALLFIGPGKFSLDAKMFSGNKKI